MLGPSHVQLYIGLSKFAKKLKSTLIGKFQTTLSGLNPWGFGSKSAYLILDVAYHQVFNTKWSFQV